MNSSFTRFQAKQSDFTHYPTPLPKYKAVRLLVINYMGVIEEMILDREQRNTRRVASTVIYQSRLPPSKRASL